MSIEQGRTSRSPHERAEVRPRFIDELSVEQEACWEVLVKMSMSQSGTLDEVMASIWGNTTLPETFRDRALLLVIGADVERNETIEGLNPEAFCPWVQDAWRYQYRTGVQLIDTEDYKLWYQDFFERGLIDEVLLEAFTSKVELAPTSPRSANVYHQLIAECEVY